MLKKLLPIMLCTFLITLIFGQTTLGANHVSEIAIEAELLEDGSAYITQIWHADFADGTEGYIPIQNLGPMIISKLSVSDEKGPYTFVENWDIEASFEEKSRKYGIVSTSEGYEICWGISEYGENRYTIEYRLDNFVGAYNDFDGFNFQFINTGMGTLPTDVTVNILIKEGLALEKNNASVWAFGFDGQVEFVEGHVKAYTEKPLSSSSDSVIIMLQMEKGLISPTALVNDSYDIVKSEALADSDYESNQTQTSSQITTQEPTEPPRMIASLIGIVITFLPGALIIYLWLRRRKLNKKASEFYKDPDYYREVPIAGNLEATFVLSDKFDQIEEDGNIIGAAFMKLIISGCLEPITEKKVGLFGKEKEKISLRLVKPPDYIGVATKLLYECLILSSGTDQILQEKELENYCYRNHKAIMDIVDACKQDGQDTLAQIKCYDHSKNSYHGLSQRGKELLANITGFRKYLLDFSLIRERTLSEGIIWQDYLIFATLLGIADKVLEQLELVYPNMTAYNENAHYYYVLSQRYKVATYHAANAGRSAGRGGNSSHGGGGGFHGGGSGGGTR